MNIKEIEIRLTNLENAFLQSQANITSTIEKADKTPTIEADTLKNIEDISNNRDGIMETFEASMVNTDDISALREGLEEVYEMLLESEVE